MKPTSVIFIILSLVLIAAGLGLCFYARNMAASQNVELFDAKTSGSDVIATYDLTNEDISRFSVTVGDCDVNIYGSESSDYVELVNFTANTYDWGVSSKTFTLDGTIGMLSVFNFAENGFKFNGLRNYLDLSQFKFNRPKTVNIYLTASSNAKVFDITAESGNVSISNIARRADYNISLKKGNVLLDYVSTSSTAAVAVDSGDIKIYTRNISQCKLDVGKGNIEFYTVSMSQQSCDLTAVSGSVTVAGKLQPDGKYTVTGSSASLTAKTGEGDITMDTIPADHPQVLPTSAETTSGK